MCTKIDNIVQGSYPKAVPTQEDGYLFDYPALARAGYRLGEILASHPTKDILGNDINPNDIQKNEDNG